MYIQHVHIYYLLYDIYIYILIHLVNHIYIYMYVYHNDSAPFPPIAESIEFFCHIQSLTKNQNQNCNLDEII